MDAVEPSAPQLTFSELLEHGFFAVHVTLLLNARDALALASVCSRAPRLRLRPLSLQHEVGEWHAPAHQYSALHWQKLSPRSPVAQVHTLLLVCRWRDQGWGNRKGVLAVMSSGVSLSGDSQPYPPELVAGRGPAPHADSPLALSFRPRTNPDGWCGHETYDLYVRVGGGGGHSLHVRQLRAFELLVLLPGEKPPKNALPPRAIPLSWATVR